MITERPPAFSAAPVETARGPRGLRRALARPSVPATVALVVVLAFFTVQTPQLLSWAGLAGILDTAAVLGIGGVAVALLMIAGQYDLSIGVVALASSLVSALLISNSGWSTWPALLVSLGAALCVGLINGLLVVVTGVHSFLVTLATFLVLQGFTLVGAQTVAEPGRVSGLPHDSGWASASSLFDATLRIGIGRFHSSLLWWLGITALATWALWRTRFGNAVLASGGARRAARELGVPVSATTVGLFCITAGAGWLIGTVGLLSTGSVQVSTPALETAVDFIVVAVIGGCLLTGGFGSAVGAAVGSLLYAVAREGIVLAGWDPRWFQTMLGVLLLVALLADGAVRRRLKAVPRS
ncbi:MAG: ABC transporter permease [Blastococcus sp.]